MYRMEGSGCLCLNVEQGNSCWPWLGDSDSMCSARSRLGSDGGEKSAGRSVRRMH